MTWHESEHFRGCMLNEHVLDVTARYLDELHEAYEDGQARGPTVDELEAALVTVMSKFGSRWFVELDGRRVTKLKLKSKPAPSSQEFTVGDVFTIPLHAGDFAFGRLLHVDEGGRGGGAIEVFETIHPRPVAEDAVLSSGRLLAPIWINTERCLASNKFTVVRSQPKDKGEYEAPDLGEIEFLVGSPARWYAEKLDGTRRVIPVDETPAWDERTRMARNPADVAFMIERRLGRRRHDWEPAEGEPALASE